MAQAPDEVPAGIVESLAPVFEPSRAPV